MSGRLKNIDILKFIGLFCIILVHTNPNSVIKQIRGFDVVLMIIISSYLFFISNKNLKSFVNYLKKRFVRLVIPTWIFLIVFFIILAINDVNKISLRLVLDSFLLRDGIGYVWIIRIYILVAILLPIIKFILEKYSFNKILICCFFIYCMYELLCFSNFFSINFIFKDIFAYIIPLSMIIIITYWIMKSNSKRILIFSFINFIIFLLLLILIYNITGEFKNTSIAKYPFRLYYLSYAFFASSILIVLFRNEKIVNFCYNNFIKFVSSSSLWIYLWHILFIYYIDYKFSNFFWFFKYVIILFLSCVTVFLQNKIVNFFEEKGFNKSILKIFKG